MKCKQDARLPVVNEWQKVLEPCCKHHHHGYCNKPDRFSEKDPCPLDGVNPLPVRESIDDVSIDDAAQALWEHLKGNNCFINVGIGLHQLRPCIYAYVRSLDEAEASKEFIAIKDGWKGYYVVLERMSAIPATFYTSKP